MGEEKAEGLNKVLADHWNYLASEYCDSKGVNLLTTHLYINKKGSALIEEPDGEKPLKIGNADLIYSEAIPKQIQYTAMGHIHSYKNIGNDEQPVVYSSSPLSYSFSEAGQVKYVVIVDAHPDQAVQLKKIALKKGKSLHRKTFNSVEVAVDWLSENKETLVELTLESDTFLKADDRKMLYQTHEGIVHLIPKVKNAQIDGQIENKEINLNQNIKELFHDYFRSKHQNQEPNQELMDLFDEVLNK